MIFLGIDTSCDDTSVGITQNRQVLANIISSQDDLHAPWGGVVPNLARRAHQSNFPIVLQNALQQAQITFEQIDAIAVTHGHGLAIALEVGLEEAKKIAQQNQIPLYAINHSVGHFLANFAQLPNQEDTSPNPDQLKFPVLALLVAGGQTQLVKITNWGKYEIIGETVDDALGEAYDKAARLLGLPYPGGAHLAQLAKQGNPQAYQLPRPMRQSKDLNVSYAGLKTAFLRLMRSITAEPQNLNQPQKADLAASFQAAALETILIKTKQALEQTKYHHLFLGGGVAANQQLRQQLTELTQAHQLQFHYPPSLKLCQDNAAMIALAGWFAHHYQTQAPIQNIDQLDRQPQLRLDDEN